MVLPKAVSRSSMEPLKANKKDNKKPTPGIGETVDKDAIRMKPVSANYQASISCYICEDNCSNL